jgi:glycine oxidase
VKAPDVLIVGGGVIGCALAYELAKRGAAVTLLERDRMGAHASGIAAGMLAPRAEASPVTAGRNPLLELGLRSLRLFPSWAAELEEASGISVEYRRSGLLRVAETQEEAAELRQREGWQRQLVAEVRWQEGEELRREEPGLGSHIVGGLLSPEEGHVQSRRWVEALVRGAQARGARFEEGTPVVGLLRTGKRVTGVRTTHGERPAGHVVLATGPWAVPFSGELGIPLPIAPVKGQLVHLTTRWAGLKRIVFAHGCYLVPRADGTVTVGSTQEDAGYDARPTAGAVGYLVERAVRLVPGLKEAHFLGAEAGLRPATPDRLPVLGAPPEWEGVTLALAHFRNGVLLSPITAQLLADFVLEGKAGPILAPFSPGRFAG